MGVNACICAVLISRVASSSGHFCFLSSDTVYHRSHFTTNCAKLHHATGQINIVNWKLGSFCIFDQKERIA